MLSIIQPAGVAIMTRSKIALELASEKPLNCPNTFGTPVVGGWWVGGCSLGPPGQV